MSEGWEIEESWHIAFFYTCKMRFCHPEIPLEVLLNFHCSVEHKEKPLSGNATDTKSILCIKHPKENSFA